MNKVKDIATRIFAVFGAEGLKVVGGGAIIGIETWKSVLLAGFLGVATVVQKLCEGLADDGKLDWDEINVAFGGKNGSK